MKTWFWLAAALAGLTAFPAQAATVVPGHSVGNVSLGMSRSAVWKVLGKPRQSFSARGYAEDDWARRWRVLSRRGRVVQIDVADPRLTDQDGVSTGTAFAAIRRRRPRMQVRMYGFDDPGGDGGYVGYYIDDRRRGEAFMVGTQDDGATYQTLPTSKPDYLIVHAPGRAALPIADGVYGGPQPRDREDFFGKISAWFAGGPHRKIHKSL